MPTTAVRRPGPAAPEAIGHLRRGVPRISLPCRGGTGRGLHGPWRGLEPRRGAEVPQAQRVHDPDCQRRFFQEAEITGRLEHPGIVPVYSLGHDGDGSPCYAMRFIRGRTLEDAIQEFHGAGGPGPAGRPHQLRGLIKRLVAVCNTIAYAHSRGVLHRDLKPKNIMLDKYDETLVVDWGLARPFGRSEADRALGEETLTPSSGNSGSGSPTAGVVGTPAYMSPEQADGRWDLVGPPSDVYSLGATLYVLLTGRAPFEGRHIGEVLDRVRRGEFPPPRQVRPRVPGPLDAVCRKSMALKIEDRYPTALALAEDLERWLADEPVTAYRDPLAVRLARWGRRHRTAAVSATALLVMAAAAMTVTTVLVERQKREVVRQKTLAEVNYRYARDAVDQMLTKVGEVDLADVPQMEPVRRKLLEEARRFYLAFLGQRGDDPATRLEAGRAHRHLGDIQEMLGDHVGAEQSYRQALGLHQPLVEESPAEPAFRQDLASDSSRIGVVLKKANRFQEAERAFRAALDLRVQLAAEAPDGLDRRQALADALYQWGALMRACPASAARTSRRTARRSSSSSSSSKTRGPDPSSCARRPGISITWACCWRATAGSTRPRTPSGRPWRSRRRCWSESRPSRATAGTWRGPRTTWGSCSWPKAGSRTPKPPPARL